MTPHKSASMLNKSSRCLCRPEELRLGGHKKARLQLQSGFFRDSVGIRTPNLRIRSAMLYPVELQSRQHRALEELSGGAKIDRHLSPPNAAQQNCRKKRNPHRPTRPCCHFLVVVPMRILQAFSSIAFGSGTPSPKLRDQRRLRSVAGPPGEFLTVLPCGRGHVRVGSSCSAPPRRTVLRQSGSPPPLSRQGRPGFPVRVGCSRLPKKPRCVLALQIFDAPLAVAIFRLLVSRPEDHVRLKSPGEPLPTSGSELISEALLPVGEPTL